MNSTVGMDPETSRLPEPVKDGQSELVATGLGKNEAFTERVLASINDCIKVLDLDARLTFMSEGGQKIMEVSDFNTIRGCSWPDFWQDQGNLDAQAAIQAAKNGESASFIGPAQTLAGNLKWWHVQVSPILGSNGRPEQILCVSRDITTLREAEEALRKLNDSLEQRVAERTRDRDRIWQLSPDLMLVAQLDGVICAVNPAWTRMLGHAEHDLVGSQLLALVHPDDLADSSSAVSRLGDGKNFPNFKNRYRHQDGSYRMIAWTAVPDSDYIHAVGRDIQAEEEAKDALRLSEDALRQSQKLEAIGQLTGGVAHDFNNLLTVIKSCADLLKTPSLSKVRRIKYVEAIASTVDRAARLTAQLLTFSRRQALRPEVFNVGDSVLRVGEMMDSLTGSRIKVTIEVPDEPCFINADESQFDTALVNMVLNARDAMAGNGHLTIQVATAAWLPSVRAHQGRIANYVTITLSDTGTGIAPEKLDAIFEPFYTTKGIGQGTGLGLSQVFGFAKQSGGEILVQSQCGKGSQFMLYLPKVEASTTPTSQDNPSAPTVSNLCVLMVEDNADVGLYTSQTLEQMGFHVLWVPDAKSALEALAPNPESFQVVFSDISMPGMSGLELLDAIEALYPWLPVVLTTGYNDEYARIAQEEAKRFVLLQKPYATETLALLLQKVVKGRLGRSLEEE